MKYSRAKLFWITGYTCCFFLSYALTVSFQTKLLFLKYCWSEVNRLSGISTANVGLFGISRELQFRVCHHGETCANPRTGRSKNAFIEGKRKLGRLSKHRSHGFSLAKSCLSPSCWALLIGRESSPFWSPNCIYLRLLLGESLT